MNELSSRFNRVTVMFLDFVAMKALTCLSRDVVLLLEFCDASGVPAFERWVMFERISCGDDSYDWAHMNATMEHYVLSLEFRDVIGILFLKFRTFVLNLAQFLL